MNNVFLFVLPAQPGAMPPRLKVLEASRYTHPYCVYGYTKIECLLCFFLRSRNLVIVKEGAPGATAEHKGLHKCSFGLDGVIQIMCGPGMKHLYQGHSAKLRMLDSSFQIFFLHLANEGKIDFPLSCELCRNLLRRLCISAHMLLIWIEIGKILSRQKSLEADREKYTFGVQ